MPAYAGMTRGLSPQRKLGSRHWIVRLDASLRWHDTGEPDASLHWHDAAVGPSLEVFLPKQRTLYLKTWGCQMNEYDSKRVSELLTVSHQLTLVDTAEEADVLIMNTCSIRENAQKNVYSDLGRWRDLKQARALDPSKPPLLIGVGGCVASQEGNALLTRAPYIDIVFGPQTLHRVPDLINQSIQSKKPVLDVSFPSIEKFDNLPEPKADGPTAFVSVQEGCNKFCKYCIVPYTRGEEVNRPLDDVLGEIAGLAAQGVREVTLLGQNVNAYRGLQHDGTVADLALLIRYIAQMDDILRIRFTTSHPGEFTESLIEAYARVPKLASHLHLPVQSGSDRVLGLMGRHYTVLEYKAIIRHLRKIRPDMTITSDFIVGYPGETEADFEQTLDLIHTIGFDNSYSFIYSPRPGTPAATLPDDTPIDVKKRRLSVLQDRLVQQATLISRRLVGTRQPILVTGSSKKNPLELQGRMESNRVVNFEGPASLIGEIVLMEITEVYKNSLRAVLCETYNAS